jgi:5-(carboxyamino)imidazole ribonucleotide synthase
VNSEFPVVGVIGAGQLARMMIAPATALGVKLLPFAASEGDSAAQITPCVIGDYTDIEAVKKFAEQCDVVTFEHELIPLHIIKALEVAGVKVRPGSESFEFSQDKEAMRKKLSHFKSPKSAIVVSSNEVLEYPVIAKSISGGYDGRGVWRVNSSQELADLLKNTPKLLVEELIDFDYEIAVMVARSPHSQATSWSPTQTIQSDGICTMTITPAPLMSEQLSEKAQKIALDIASEIKLIGVMAVEMFVKDDEIFINELAMRPHNSGHWTIEGSQTSQFEQHLRAILDLPLGNPTMRDEFAVMGNILGKSKTDMYRPYLHLMARNPSLKFHMYGKEVRPGRKIGHVNVIGKDLVELRTEIEHAVDYMSGEIDE